MIGADYRQGCWAESFPPFEQPWMVPLWLLDMHTGTMMAYPVGDKHGGSVVTFLLVVAGAWRLYRQDRKASLAMLAGTFRAGSAGRRTGQISLWRHGADNAIRGAVDLPADGFGDV